MAKHAPNKTFGFDEFLKRVRPAASRARTRAELRKALSIAGKHWVKTARGFITSKRYAPNAPRTIAAKGSATPLINHGDLMRSITSKVEDDPLALILGANSPLSKKGEPIYRALHEGATIKRGKGVIILPPRPFLRAAWEDAGWIAKLRELLNAAIARVYAPKDAPK